MLPDTEQWRDGKEIGAESALPLGRCRRTLGWQFWRTRCVLSVKEGRKLCKTRLSDGKGRSDSKALPWNRNKHHWVLSTNQIHSINQMAQVTISPHDREKMVLRLRGGGVEL